MRTSVNTAFGHLEPKSLYRILIAISLEAALRAAQGEPKFL